MSIELTTSQKTGDRTFSKWFNNKGYINKPVLRIGGPAGTGKTFFLRYLIEKFDLNETNCLIAAYTGQAVSVLRQIGIHAKTIHSTFYHTIQEQLVIDGKPIERNGIPIMVTRHRPREFIPSNIKLILLDEGSFINESMLNVIMRYGVPIFITGDPIQLPPVVGKECFHVDMLDCVFEDVMRQAKDSDILRLSTDIRLGKPINMSTYGNGVLFIHPKNNAEKNFTKYMPFFKYSDTIITVSNKQRDEITALYRKHIIKTDSKFPIKGEKLICRRNNFALTLGDIPLTNGTMGIALSNTPRSAIDMRAKTFYTDFKPLIVNDDYFDNIICDSDYITQPFGNKETDFYNAGNKLEFAHAITTHLSQGAQFKSVMFVDKFINDVEYSKRLHYTAITRAKEYLVYMLPQY